MKEAGAPEQDKKLLFRAVLWAVTAFLLWNLVANRIWPPPPRPTSQPVPSSPTVAQGPEEGPPPVADEGPSRQDGEGASPPGGAVWARGATEEQSFRLGDDSDEEGPFRMEVRGTNLGAAVQFVTLTDYAAHVHSAERYMVLSPGIDGEGRPAGSFSPEKIYVNEHEIDLTRVPWRLEQQSTSEGDSVVCTLDILQADAVVGRLTRTYQLPRQSKEQLRHDLSTDLTVENLADQSQSVRVILRGPIGVQKADMRFDDRSFFTAIRPSPDSPPGVHMTQARQVEGKADIKLDDDQTPGELVWAALANKFFAALIAPSARSGGGDTDYLKTVQAVDLDVSQSHATAASSDLTLRFISQTFRVSSGESVSFPMTCYLGPKSAEAFRDTRNADYVARNYYGQIPASYNVGMCAFITPSWLVQLMLLLLGWLKAVVFNYGLAIILLVLIVRAILHPLTKHTQVNMVRMQEKQAKIAPKLEELKKRLGNDKTRLAQEQMKLMAEEGIHPSGQLMTCLPMFIQMPIWIALYTSLSYNIDMRHQPFVFWIKDLTSPDGLIEMFDPPGFHIPLLGAMTGPITTLNVLPLLLALAMFLQQKLMPKPTPPPSSQSSAAADQAAQMQKMMPFMSLMFGIFMYNMPSGLTLYIMASTVFGTIEQLVIRKHIKEKKERGVLFSSRKEPPADGPASKLLKSKKKSTGLLARLQKMAEEAQRRGQ